jgi:predicted nucleic acid-binding protein
MGRLTERLSAHTKIGLDTSIFIYHFEANPNYLPITTELLSSIEGGQREAVTSTITLMELIVHPLKLNRQDVARKYEALLVNFPHLQIVDLDRNVIRQAAQLRADFRIRPADALQAAACLVNSVTAFITNDKRLDVLQPRFEVIVLEDYSRDG